jgi:hypothetical protein
MGDLPSPAIFAGRPMARPMLRGSRTKKSPYECRFHFQPWVRSVIRAKEQNARPIAQPTDRSEDCERNEPDQPGCRLFRRWNADHCEPPAIGPEWFLGRQFCSDGRRYWRNLSGHGFPCRRLSLLQILRQTFCCVLSQPSDLRSHFILRSK